MARNLSSLLQNAQGRANVPIITYRPSRGAMPRARPSSPARTRRKAAARAVAEPPSEHGRQTRDRILEAAIELIAERGFAATSIDALCQRACVVRTAIYW